MQIQRRERKVESGFMSAIADRISQALSTARPWPLMAKAPGVIVSRHQGYMCSEPGQNQIKADIQEHRLNRIVVASCSPRLHEPTFRKCVAEAGLNPYLMEMANIREQCSWVHAHDPAGATQQGEGPGALRRGPGPAAGRRAKRSKFRLSLPPWLSAEAWRGSRPRSIWPIRATR